MEVMPPFTQRCAIRHTEVCHPSHRGDATLHMEVMPPFTQRSKRYSQEVSNEMQFTMCKQANHAETKTPIQPPQRQQQVGEELGMSLEHPFESMIKDGQCTHANPHRSLPHSTVYTLRMEATQWPTVVHAW